MQERRVFPRLPMRLKVAVRLSSGSVISLRSIDISKQGIQLLSEYNADAGDRFQLGFHLPRPGGEGFDTIQVKARVVHVIYDGSAGGYRVGFQFEEFYGDCQAQLEASLDAQLNHHLRRGRG